MEENSNIIIQPLRSPFPQHRSYIWPPNIEPSAAQRASSAWCSSYGISQGVQGTMGCLLCPRLQGNQKICVSQSDSFKNHPRSQCQSEPEWSRHTPSQDFGRRTSHSPSLHWPSARAALPWVCQCWVALLWQFTHPISCHPSAFLSFLVFLGWLAPRLCHGQCNPFGFLKRRCMRFPAWAQSLSIGGWESRVQEGFRQLKGHRCPLGTDSWPQPSTDPSKTREEGFPRENTKMHRGRQ